MEVKLYIETSLAGPCVKDGYYAAMAEYITKKGPALAWCVGMEKETTHHRSTLIAIIKGLKLLKSSSKVTIYTYCHFIKGIYERGTMEEWKRTEWKKSTGEDVKNKELWQQFFEEVERMGGRENIEFRFSKHNNYREKLQEIIAEERQKIEKKKRENP